MPRCDFNRVLATALPGLLLLATAAEASLHSTLPLDDRNLLEGQRFLRHLQNENAEEDGPTRSCGQVIGITPKDLFLPLLELWVDALFPPEGDTAEVNAGTKFAMRSASQFDVAATKICASCEEIWQLYDGDERLQRDLPNGFSTYCAPGMFWYDTVVSGVMFQPYNATSNSFVPGGFKGAMAGSFTNSSSLYVPSERWRFDFNEFLVEVAAASNPVGLVALEMEMLVPAYVASAGAVFVMSDYVGYGEDWKGTKGYITKKSYQLASSVLWLKAVQEVASVTRGCASLQPSASLFGYSEGGYNAVASSAALQDLGVEVVGVTAGGGPYRLPPPYDPDNVDEFTQSFAFALFVHAYSSTNPDQPNTDEGQDLGSDEWKEDIIGWINEGLPSFVVGTLVGGNPLKTLNPTFVNGTLLVEEDPSLGNTCSAEFADTYPELVQDKLCEAFAESDLIGILESATYPVEFCHSPDDDVVDFRHLPDISANPEFLSYFDDFPIAGNHPTAFVPCMMAALLAYLRPGRTEISPPDGDMMCPSLGDCPAKEKEDAEFALWKASGEQKERITCSQLAALEDESAIRFHCEAVPRAAKQCRVTCDTCRDCVDSETKTFRKYHTKVTRNCGWLGKRKSKTVDRLCGKYASVRLACAKTCGTCA